MGNAYQLTCTCGYTLEVTLTQAGSLQHCPQCRASIEVPPMRQLRQLPEVQARPEVGGHAQHGIRWSRLRGVAFSGGLFVMLVSLLISGLLLRTGSQLHTTPPTLAELHPPIDLSQIPPADVWDAWVTQFRDQNLEHREAPWFLQQQILQRRINMWLWVWSAVALAGLATAVAATLLRPPVPRHGPTRPQQLSHSAH